jgi:hypothetical protein
MNIVKQAAVCTRVWTTAEVVNLIRKATYKNATDTADVEYLYRSLGLLFTSLMSNHVPVGQVNR